MLARLRRPDALTTRQAAAAVGAGRAAVGLAVLFAPGLSRAASGLGDRPGSVGHLLGRFFAIRETAMGLAMVAECAAGEPSTASLAVNAATDLADALALVGGARSSGRIWRPAVLGLPASVGAAGLWLWLLGHRLNGRA